MATKEITTQVNQSEIPLVHQIERVKARTADTSKTLELFKAASKEDKGSLNVGSPLQLVHGQRVMGPNPLPVGSPTYDPHNPIHGLAAGDPSLRVLNPWASTWRLVIPPYEPINNPGPGATTYAYETAGILDIDSNGPNLGAQVGFAFRIKSPSTTVANISPSFQYTFDAGPEPHLKSLRGHLTFGLFVEASDGTVPFTRAARPIPDPIAIAKSGLGAHTAGDETDVKPIQGRLPLLIPLTPIVFTMQASVDYKVSLLMSQDLSYDDGGPFLETRFRCTVPWFFMSTTP